MMDVIKKSAITARSKTETVRFSGFSNVKTAGKEFLVASDAKNCDCKNGVLSRGVGKKIFQNEDGNNLYINGDESCVAAAYSYVPSSKGYSKQLMCLEESGSLRIFWTDKKEYEKIESFGGRRRLLYFINDQREFEYVFYGKDGASVFSEEMGRKDFQFIVTAACVYNHRLFMATSPFQIVYTAPGSSMDITETIEESGEFFYYSEGGEIVAMQALGSCIYLFSEHAIARLTVKGSATEFTVEKVSYAGGEIFGDSVGIFGDWICFLASDGVYFFDGKKAEKRYENFPILPKREGQVCNYCIFEDQYILRYVDENGVTKMAVLDSDGKNGYFAFVPDGIFDLEGAALLQNGEELCRFQRNGDLPDGETAVFTSEKMDFGGGKTSIRKIRLEGEGSVTLTVTADGVEKSVTLQFDKGKAETEASCFGEEFVFALQVYAGSKVRSMEVVTERIGG